MQLTFNEIWRGIDALAQNKGMSVSGLAGKAGLNSTTFNKSKRVGADGKKRWPSTESVNKVLEATGTTMDEFMSFAAGQQGYMAYPKRTIPLLSLAKAGKDKYFGADGLPCSAKGWDGVDFPDGLDTNAYALEVADSSMEPLYREGDRLIVQPAADIRKGDRVVVKTVKGAVLVKELKRKSAMQLELKSLGQKGESKVIDVADVAWIARILWVSQ